jgi:NAD(P) transhydrogenase subunit alpha
VQAPVLIRNESNEPLVEQSPDDTPQATLANRLGWVGQIAALFLLFVIIGAAADHEFVMLLSIFVLAICTGYMVIWNVTPALHTPLMSVTNAISGIIVIGGMLELRTVDGSLLDGASFCGWLGVFFASINVIGGFVVTQRMLQMFRKD